MGALFSERRGRSDGQEGALEPENTPDAEERGEEALQCHLPRFRGRGDTLTRRVRTQLEQAHGGGAPQAEAS